MDDYHICIYFHILSRVNFFFFFFYNIYYHFSFNFQEICKKFSLNLPYEYIYCDTNSDIDGYLTVITFLYNPNLNNKEKN